MSVGGFRAAATPLTNPDHRSQPTLECCARLDAAAKQSACVLTSVPATVNAASATRVKHICNSC